MKFINKSTKHKPSKPSKENTETVSAIKEQTAASETSAETLTKEPDESSKEKVGNVGKIEKVVGRKWRKEWMTGRPWLRKGNNLMWCSYCRNHESKISRDIRSRIMIDGTSNFKYETIAYHEASKAHTFASTIQRNTQENQEKL